MAVDTMLAFSENVRRLMEARQWTQPQLSQRSGVGQTTLSAILRYRETGEKVATLSTVGAIAKAFGLPAWMMQIPDIPIDVLQDGTIARLIDTYAEVGPEAREHIRRVADGESRYELLRQAPKAG